MLDNHRIRHLQRLVLTPLPLLKSTFMNGFLYSAALLTAFPVMAGVPDAGVAHPFLAGVTVVEGRHAHVQRSPIARARGQLRRAAAHHLGRFLHQNRSNMRRDRSGRGCILGTQLVQSLLQRRVRRDALKPQGQTEELVRVSLGSVDRLEVALAYAQ